jgi:hypothetical protein
MNLAFESRAYRATVIEPDALTEVMPAVAWLSSFFLFMDALIALQERIVDEKSGFRSFHVSSVTTPDNGLRNVQSVTPQHAGLRSKDGLLVEISYVRSRVR